MSVRKIKGSWFVDFSYNFERMRKSSPLNTKGGAQAFEVHLRQLVAQHGSVAKVLEAMKPAPEEQVLTFAEFSDRWLRDYVDVNNKPCERRTKRIVLRTHLLPVFGRQPLAGITVHAVEQFKASLQRASLSHKTINNYLTILHKCLATAVDWGLLAAAPRCRFLKTIPPTMRFLSTLEVDSLVSAAPAPVWATMILVAARTGLRFSELVALEWGDIDFAAASVRVCRANVRGHLGATKNNRIRHVPLTSDAATAFRSLGESQGLVFLSRGHGVTYNAASWYLERTCRIAGIPPIGWHVLRHTFASELALRGASLQAIKELLGHSTINMVLRYAHLAPNGLRNAIALLESPAPTNVMATWRQPEVKTSPLVLADGSRSAALLGQL